MENKIKTKNICEDTISVSVILNQTKGAMAFLNNIAGSVSKYLIDNDLPLLYLEIDKTTRKEKLLFVFKENDFLNNKEVCVEFVKEFMNEISEINVKREISSTEIESELKCFKNFENKLGVKKNIVEEKRIKP